MKTPFGEVLVTLDGKPVPVTAIPAARNERVWPQVEDAWLLKCDYARDGKRHRLCCVLDAQADERREEGGERLEMTSLYCGNGKLSIGVEGDFCEPPTFPYDYGGRNLPNGVEIEIREETADRAFLFGVAWLRNCAQENDLQTWFAADPTVTKPREI